MDESIKKLEQKLERLNTERESLFYELGKAYYSGGDMHSETAKCRDKIRNVDGKIGKVKTAIDEVREASMTV